MTTHVHAYFKYRLWFVWPLFKLDLFAYNDNSLPSTKQTIFTCVTCDHVILSAHLRLRGCCQGSEDPNLLSILRMKKIIEHPSNANHDNDDLALLRRRSE